MTSNLAMGSEFEQDFCLFLAQRGFWVHRMAQNAAGQQPADVIAVKGRFHALIDCKVVSTVRGFPFSRVEDNQRTAMTLFEQCGQEDGWFAIKLPSGKVEMLSLWQIENYELNGRKSLSTQELDSGKFTISLDAWLRRAASA